MTGSTDPITGSTGPIAAEIAARPVEATLTGDAGRWILAMTRELPQTADRIWPKLTEPGELSKWSPVVPDRPLTSLGPATSHESPDADGVDVEVLACDPPRELVHRWGGHLLGWTLTPTPNGSRLILAQTFAERAERGMYGAGWHICLAVLAVVLDGQNVDRVVGSRANDYGWPALRDRYDATLG
jgi:uncharacterized protein YndB with AHSA1/START domain